MQKYTIRDLERDFPTEESCMEWLVGFLYPDGIFCLTCDAATKHHRVKSRTSYSCDRCGHHEHPMAGTIFQDTRTPLRSWFHAIFLMASTRCGISAKQLERELGVTYKTAWRMFTQIRKLLADDSGPLTGEVEIDETFIGGKLGNNSKYRNVMNPLANKIAVIGAVERGGTVKAQVIPNVRKSSLLPMVMEHIMPHATVFTDEHRAYDGLAKHGYTHHRINHSARVYVRGNVHTNTIEGFWSLLKNGIRGAHHAVGSAYLQSYVNEYTFRYNHRGDDTPMFLTMLAQVWKS